MKDSTEVVAAGAICMLVTFLLGMWASTDNITYNVDGDRLGYQHVTYEGEIRRGEYLFNFTKNFQNSNSNLIINGRTWPRNSRHPERVKLRTGRSAEKILETCRHELLHHYFPDYKHPDFSKPGVSRSDDPIYRLEDQVNLPVCDDITATALQRQR